MAGMCIVHDEHQTLLHLTEMLDESCHTSRFPPQPELILALLEREPCDLILPDVDLSSIDAMALLRQLKCRQDHRAIPVLFLAAETDERALTLYLKKGAADCVRQPVEPLILQARVKAALAPRAQE